MTKAELIKLLEPYNDETIIEVDDNFAFQQLQIKNVTFKDDRTALIITEEITSRFIED